MSLDIKFTRQGLRTLVDIQHAFSKPSLVNLISKTRTWYSVYPFLCDDGIKKSVPHDHLCYHSASLRMPIDDPRDGFFYHTLTLMIDSYNLTLGHIRQHSFKQILYQKLGRKRRMDSSIDVSKS